MPAPRPTTCATAADMEQRRRWTAALLAAPEDLPIAFTYGGQEIRGIPAEWQPTRARRRIDANLVETVFTGVEPASGLRVRVECLEYADHPVVEWTAWLEAAGTVPTALIEGLRALDAPFAGAAPVLAHCNGDFYSEEGYATRETALRTGDELSFAPRGGRPCDGAFPYFRLAFDGAVLTAAVGWPAQWSAAFTGLAGGVRLQAGQETVSLRLMPGERIRTPRITLLSSVGDAARSVNLWRRWVRDHVLPRTGGAPLPPKLACSCNDGGEEFTGATTENQLRFMEDFRRHGLDFDIWWIDAGWYPCADERGERHWPLTGTWTPDSARFPAGLGPVGERAAAGGAGLLLWFEPERVVRGSRLDLEHPEWLLRVAAKDGEPAANRLLDLGNPECRRWLTEHVTALIRESGIAVYRQDFNFEPLRYWRENEPPERRGLRENLHVQGYLQYWDDLLAANPGLWIDSCASGGRRNDLETMRRSVPLHYSDYGYGLHPVKLAFQHTMYSWIPYFKESALSWDILDPGEGRWFEVRGDAFAYHCAMAPMLATALDIRRPDCDHGLHRRMIAVWRAVADLLLAGDYHPLTPVGRAADHWVVRQFHRPEGDVGFIQAVRHRDCTEEALMVRPRDLRPDGVYTLENPETGQALELPGAVLAADGLPLRQPARTGAIWVYRWRAGEGAGAP